MLPDQEKLHARLQGKWYMRPFEFLLYDPALWHIGRRGTCRALALGVFIACLPIPGHMILAVLGALYWRMNLPVAVAAVWVNNPLTFGPIWYVGYKLGTWMLNPLHLGEMMHEPVGKTWRVPELNHTWHAIEAFLLGCVAEGLILAVIAYIVFDLAWRLSIRGRWKLRRIEREGSGSF
jgi:uncharacterized protein (DUF2062 family)